VDVSTEEEFVAAFNSFDGHFAIFDGHGVHDRSHGEGTLRVGQVGINPFRLYGKLRVPPIVFLSACETHPLEGIESSVASAFLFMGARSVLGTLVPVDAFIASVLVGRFLFRLGAFLPLLSTVTNWSEVVSGMLRMSYVTDVLFKMEEHYGCGTGGFRSVQIMANLAINTGDPNWFEQMLAGIAAEVSEPETRVRELWLQNCYFTETLRYVHLGTPEHLFITPDEDDGDAPEA